MGEDEKALGQRLQKARQNAGLTQQELCQKANLSYSTLAKIERGAIKSPSVFTVAAIAHATGSAMEDLLDLVVPSTQGKKTSKTGVKFVYFDLNGTLVRFFEKAFTKIANETGLPIDAVESAYWHYDNSVCDGSLSMADFNTRMAEKLGLDSFDWTKYYTDAAEAMPGMKELVEWTAANYRVGLLSGTMPGLIDSLTSAGKLPFNLFSSVIDSSAVKCLKLSPKIYEIAQEKADAAPGEILLVDDDHSSLKMAGQLGWQISRFDTYDPEGSIARVKTHLEF